MAKKAKDEDPPVVTNVGDSESRFDLGEGPTAAMRRPLTVLAILAPLGLLAELYRFLSEQKATLLTEAQWAELGSTIGVSAPIVPVLVLAAGCVAVQLIRRYAWELPAASTVLLCIGWGALWAMVRYAVAFTADSIHGGAAAVTADETGGLTALGQVGLSISGALQEELVFRGGLLGLLCLIGRALHGGRWLDYAVMLPLSAIMFSLAHTGVVNHQPAAETFDWSRFMQRSVAGLLYGYIFLRQGMATATIAHAGYNVAILFRLGPWL